MPVFVIEHLEPRLWKWSYFEYEHISKLVGKKNLIFTNLTSKRARSKLARIGNVEKLSVGELKLKNPCVLDLRASVPLNPMEARGFSHFVFGGILGDSPPKGRTRILRERLPGASFRNLGKKQMSTDNAVATVVEILNGNPLSKIKFIDEPEIILRPGESVVLPYRYLADEMGLPLLTPGLLNLLLRSKTF